MRTYLVIPEGTAIIRVEASTPHFAASKARGGKGEYVHVTEPAVMAASSATDVGHSPQVIPGQLSWSDHGHEAPA